MIAKRAISILVAAVFALALVVGASARTVSVSGSSFNTAGTMVRHHRHRWHHRHHHH